MTSDFSAGPRLRNAVGRWLLAAAPDTRRARHEWSAHGVALLRCGGVFDAVRVPVTLVHAVADTAEPGAVGAFLAEFLDGGPVFFGVKNYYALTTAGDARTWTLPESDYLGSGAFLGVPAADRTGPDVCGSYWSVPVGRPGAVCATEDVARLVLVGRARAAQKAKEAGDHE